jgi:hypothetical protein
MVGLDFDALAVSSREPFETCALSVTVLAMLLVRSAFQQRTSRAPMRRCQRTSPPRIEGHALWLPARSEGWPSLLAAGLAEPPGPLPPWG